MIHEEALVRTAAATLATYDFSGRWTNELGSYMDVVQQGEQLTGTYNSTVSGGGDGVTGVLLGWASGFLVTISVNWQSQAALTSWVGQLVTPTGAPAYVQTLWQMTNAIADPTDPDELWNSVWTGCDQFNGPR